MYLHTFRMLVFLPVFSFIFGLYSIYGSENIDFEGFGPTRMNAMVGNGGLSVGISQWGEVTVLRYPSPSFWDQLDFKTQFGEQSRELKYFGALRNQGAFFLLKKGNEIVELRDLSEIKQEYVSDDSTILKTEYVLQEEGLSGKITVEDFVHHSTDIFIRWVYPEITADGKEKIYIVHYQNFAPTTIKRPKFPTEDWIDDTLNDFAALSLGDAVLHFIPYFPDRRTMWDEYEKIYNFDFDKLKQYAENTTGIFLMTKILYVDGGKRGNTINYVGFDGRCGGRREEPIHKPEGAFSMIEKVGEGDENAFNSPSFSICSADSFNAAEMCGEDGSCRQVVFILSAGKTLEEARQNMEFAVKNIGMLRSDVENFWKNRVVSKVKQREWYSLLSEPEKKLCTRAFISLMQATDRDSGATVASISTQPPYAEDWPRDGAYFNMYLDIAGFSELAKKRNLFYVMVQSKEEEEIAGETIPAGTFRMNFYADGMVGGPWDFEIDQVGFVVWSWANHIVNFSKGDSSFLEKVYPALKLSVYEVLIKCRSEDGLQCLAHEDDVPYKKITMVGSAMVYAGLKHALKVAELVGDHKFSSDIKRRIEELRSAMIERYSDGNAFVFSPSSTLAEGMPYLMVPANFDFPSDEWIIDYGRKIIDVLEFNFSPERGFLMYEGKWIISLIASAEKLGVRYPDIVKKFRAEAEKYLRVLVEEVPTSTWHMGEAARYIPEKGRYENRIATPHIWQATLTCLTAIALRYPRSLELMGIEISEEKKKNPEKKSSPPACCGPNSPEQFASLILTLFVISLIFSLRITALKNSE